MKYPEFLKEGGTIGLVAPSMGCATEPYQTAFQSACRKWKAMGYRLDIGPNCYENSGIGISNTPQKCGEELTEYYQREENQVLISCGGGELMCEILDYIDWKKLENTKPKWYMGYSDNTNFTFLLATLLDTASIYGPCATAFGMEPWHPAIYDAMAVISGKKQKIEGYPLWQKESKKDEDHPLEPYYVTEPRILHIYMPEKGEIIEQHKDMPAIRVEGRLLGGCMDCLVNILGTSYDKTVDFIQKYKEDGILWFLESCDLNVMAIRRAVWQMDHAGWFQNAKGFLIGRPMVYGQEFAGLDQYRAITDLLSKYQVPIIMDADLGHLPPMMPIICGSKGYLQVKEGSSLELDMRLV